MRPIYRLLTVLLIPILTLVATAENWPGWRGPRGDGSSTSQSLPLEWDAATGKNILWKTPIPGTGHASPIIWEDPRLHSHLQSPNTITAIDSHRSQIG